MTEAAASLSLAPRGTSEGGAAPPLLELADIVKQYGPVTALAHGEIRCEAGSIHAVMGENGAGKSTLIKIISGVVAPTSGVMRLDGKAVRFRGPADAQAQESSACSRNFR